MPHYAITGLPLRIAGWFGIEWLWIDRRVIGWRMRRSGVSYRLRSPAMTPLFSERYGTDPRNRTIQLFGGWRLNIRRPHPFQELTPGDTVILTHFGRFGLRGTVIEQFPDARTVRVDWSDGRTTIISDWNVVRLAAGTEGEN